MSNAADRIVSRATSGAGLDGGRMLLGSEMERMSDPARAQVVEQIHVFVRVSPA